MVVVGMVVVSVMVMVFGNRRYIVQSKGHGFNQGVQAQTDECYEAKAVPMHVPMLHALAQEFEANLDEEACDDPLAGMEIHAERLGK